MIRTAKDVNSVAASLSISLENLPGAFVIAASFASLWAAQGRTRGLERALEGDEEAIAQLTQIKGIGRWSAEIYLLFAEGRQDIWPAGDLAPAIRRPAGRAP